MSQLILFSFGCVIFFITATGAFLYGMYTLRDYTNRDHAESAARKVVRVSAQKTESQTTGS